MLESIKRGLKQLDTWAYILLVISFIATIGLAVNHNTNQNLYNLTLIFGGIALFLLVLDTRYSGKTKYAAKKAATMSNLLTMTVGIGLVFLAVIFGIMGVYVGNPAQFIREIAIFTILGFDFILTNFLAFQSGRDTEFGEPSLQRIFVITVVDAIILALVATGFRTNPLDLILLYVISKGALLAIYSALGAKFQDAKAAIASPSEYLHTFLTMLFAGLVFLIALAAILIPVSFLLAYSGQSVSTIVNVQNPLVNELLQQTETTSQNSLTSLEGIARSLAPDDLEAFVIDVDVLGGMMVVFWTGVLGFPLNTPGGELTIAQIAFTEVYLMIVFLLGIMLVSDSGIGFKGDMSHLQGIYNKLFKRGDS